MLRLMLSLCVVVLASTVLAEPPAPDTRRGDAMIANYFKHETAELRDRCLAEVTSLEDWTGRKEQSRRQLLEMLGLDPLPEKTPLHPKITGQVEHDGFTVEKLHFQSRPGLYVTGNLYVPRDASKPLPAILYVCGHGRVKKDGVSYGNKVHYHHHGSWFARHGYVCLTIDTLQLGEIEGIHHGTHRENMWWWLNRGYTPAGVEAWNCVRAIDYLQSRDEVDDARIGVTGRSGGGAYSWWIAAIDDRIKCAVPVAGVTDLQSHVVDGCVEGHCDCMFLVNTYRWDYPLVAALVAPRPLLISNTDSDGIFPLDGVYRTFEKVRTIYSLYEAADKVALNITAGPHQDTQELRVHAFRWLNRHLKGDESLIEQPAVKYFEPEQLRVFDELPTHEANTAIHESFVATAEVPIPTSEEAWHVLRDRWRQALVDKVFAGWPARESPLDIQAAFTVEREGVVFRAVDFTSQRHIRLRLYGVHRAGLDKPDLLTLNVLDTGSWSRFLGTMRVAFEAELDGETLPGPDEQAWGAMRDRLRSSSQILAYVAPRGIGPTAWDQDARKQTQHRRRFYLLGQSLDGMRVYDVRRAIQSIRAHLQGEVPIRLKGRGRMAGIALYASLFEPDVASLNLHDLPRSHRHGPFFLNVRRYLDLPQAVALAAERSRVTVHQAGADGWEYVTETRKNLGWEEGAFQSTVPATSNER